MNQISISCRTEIFSSINPSEDPNKVKNAIQNVIPDCNIQIEKFSIKGESENINSLDTIHQYILSMHHQRIYKKILERNLTRNSTWFYLNKQAAFAGKVILCEESDESPLGPIRVVLTSNKIEQIIEKLIFDEEIS